jgi:hypothetical protein
MAPELSFGHANLSDHAHALLQSILNIPFHRALSIASVLIVKTLLYF